jgi:hypothetical protein
MINDYGQTLEATYQMIIILNLGSLSPTISSLMVLLLSSVVTQPSSQRLQLTAIQELLSQLVIDYSLA